MTNTVVHVNDDLLGALFLTKSCRFNTLILVLSASLYIPLQQEFIDAEKNNFKSNPNFNIN